VLLGGVEVWDGDVRLALGPPLQRTLFALLALEPGAVVTVDRLIDALWGEALPRDARGLVHNYVSRLRKAIRPAGVEIDRRAAGYVLEVAPSTVDLHEFRVLVRTAAGPDDLRRALDLWQGQALGGVAHTDVLARVRAGLDLERLTVAEEWVTSALDAGKHQDVLAELSSLAAAHPLRENLIRLEMVALYRCGRQAEALSRYDDTRVLLAAELGLDPGADLKDAHARILRADPSLLATEPDPAPRSASAHVALPFDIPDFTGRDEELAEVCAHSTVVMIDGMAGVGKTALAVRAVHQLGDRYPDARVFVDLHGFTPGREPLTAHTAIQTLLQAMGVPSARIPSDVDQRVTAWRKEMVSRRAVIVLDNAASSSQVDPLLTGAPGCLTLVTSRRRLVLPGATPVSLDVLSPDEAHDLVAGIVGARAAEEPESVAALVELCGGLPLALRIAAARLAHRPTWTVADLVERLGEQRRTLTALAAGDRNVVASFALSYDHLTSAQQEMFRALGRHPGPDLDAHAASALAGVPFLDARDQLEELLDHHLLVQRVRGRYTFHDLVRAFARSQAGEDGELGGLYDYYLRAAHSAAHFLQPGREFDAPTVSREPARLPVLGAEGAAMEWFSAERENLVATALHAARTGIGRYTWEILGYIGHSLIVAHRLDDLVAVQEPALAEMRRNGDRTAEMRGQYMLMQAGYAQARYRDAVGHAEQSIALAREFGDEKWESDTLVVRAMLAHRLGRFDESRALGHAALPVLQRNGSYRMAAICVANIGRAHLVCGEAEQAQRHLDKALVLSREIGERSEEASVLCGLGAAHSRLGAHEQALELLDAGLVLAQELGNEHYAMRGLIKTADALRRAGRLTEARVLGERAFSALGHGAALDHLSTAHNVFGAMERADGRPAEAVRHHQDALSIASRIEYRVEEAHALDGLARAHQQTGRHSVASMHRGRADDLYRQMGVQDRLV
jgi:DNA-binding SARP family transcriptional activator/tetratricopeptide (TPR) repeat protein